MLRWVVKGSGTLPNRWKPTMPAASGSRETSPPAASALTLEANRNVLPVVRVIERLDAVGIARQQHLPALGVPQGEREHAAQRTDHGGTEHPVGWISTSVSELLRKRAALGFEIPAQRLVIVDLAVERHDDPAVGAAHRLGAGFGEVDDGKPAMAEADPAIVRIPFAETVGTTRGHEIAGAPQRFLVDASRRAVCVDPVDAAHG